MTDAPEFSREATRVSRGRREFKCCECGGPIIKGEQYHLLTGKWSGEMQSHRYHAICHEIMRRQQFDFSNAGVHWDDMPAIGEMVEAAFEDARETEDFPAYWPRGVWVSRRALAAYVVDQRQALAEHTASVVHDMLRGIASS